MTAKFETSSLTSPAGSTASSKTTSEHAGHSAQTVGNTVQSGDVFRVEYYAAFAGETHRPASPGRSGITGRWPR
jgi:hypothetical protein